MSDQDRHEKGRSEATRHEAGETEDTGLETPDVEAHRFETGSRADMGRAEGRADQGTEPEERHRNENI